MSAFVMSCLACLFHNVVTCNFLVFYAIIWLASSIHLLIFMAFDVPMWSSFWVTHNCRGMHFSCVLLQTKKETVKN